MIGNLLIEGEIAGRVANSNCTGNEDKRIALKRLQGQTRKGLRRESSEQHQAETEGTHHTAEGLEIREAPYKSYQEAGEIAVAEEMEADQDDKDKGNPQENIHAVRLHISFVVTTSLCQQTRKYNLCNFRFMRSTNSF